MKTQDEELKDCERTVIANMSLFRPVNIDDIRYAVRKGFSKGIRFITTQKEEEIKGLIEQIERHKFDMKDLEEQNTKLKEEVKRLKNGK